MTRNSTYHNSYFNIIGSVESLFVYSLTTHLLVSSSLNSHIQCSHRSQEAKKNKVYKCAICKHICQNRKELYSHCMSKHGGIDLYEIPNYVEDLNNPELQAEYAMNRRHILSDDETLT